MRRFLVAAVAVTLLAVAPVAAAAPEIGISDRLEDRRYLASSERAYVVGFEDGRFYANGWHITGEMGGVWTPPLKLVDGVWFGVEDQWIGPATEFRSGWGYTEMDLPPTAGLQLSRTDFAPDGGRAALFGLHVRNPGAAARTVAVKVDAHSELLGPIPGASTTSSRTRARTSPIRPPSTAQRLSSAIRARSRSPRRTTGRRWWPRIATRSPA